MSIDKLYDVSFQALVRVLERVEATRSRNEMIAILADYLSALPVDDLVHGIYLMQGSIGPVYQNIPFQIARKTVDKIVMQLLNMSTPEFQEQVGAYADAPDMVRKKLSPGEIASQVTIAQVVDRLTELQRVTGAGSVKSKEELVIQLCHEVADVGGIAFLLRMLQGTLRAGFSDMTILAAIGYGILRRNAESSAAVDEALEKAYMRCADLGYLARCAYMGGLAAVRGIQVRPGIPLMPAAAERLHQPEEIIHKLGVCGAQPKLDGLRLQVHKVALPSGDGAVRIFSRHLHDVTDSFPEIAARIALLPEKEIILEGEVIAYDPDKELFLPFAQTAKRKRKHDIAQATVDIPVSLFIFDILYQDGVELLDEPHYVRRGILQNMAPLLPKGLYVVPERLVHDAQELQDYFQECLEHGLEGLVVKKLDAPYQAGKRGFAWIKLKRHQENLLADTIDTVILGYYAGQGKRAQLGIGAFLVGVYNPELSQFQTIAKVGTGLSDEQWISLKAACDVLKIAEKPANVQCAPVLYPDVWVRPDLVCEVATEEITVSPVHSAGKTDSQQGLALRFPRFIKLRSDKSPFQTTTPKELLSLRRS